jgi:hypothetical protein
VCHAGVRFNRMSMQTHLSMQPSIYRTYSETGSWGRLTWTVRAGTSLE